MILNLIPFFLFFHPSPEGERDDLYFVKLECELMLLIKKGITNNSYLHINKKTFLYKSNLLDKAVDDYLKDETIQKIYFKSVCQRIKIKQSDFNIINSPKKVKNYINYTVKRVYSCPYKYLFSLFYDVENHLELYIILMENEGDVVKIIGHGYHSFY